ncbi:MAG: hypothetical protein E4G95_07290, partial [Bacteroidia bacterium]
MSRLRNIISILLYFLASVTGIILFLFALLNMPFTHRALTSQVNAILTRSGAPVSIGNIKMIMPTTLMVTGVVYNNYMGDTIFYAGSVQTDYSPISLLRKKVVLRGAIVDTAVISLKSSQEVNPDDKQEHVSKGSAPDFPAKTNNKRSWVITLDSGDLSAITFLMENPESGINISQEVDGIRVSGFRLSLQEKEITAMSASIMGSDGLIEILPALQTSEEKTDSEWSYLISSLSLDNLNLTYRDMVRDLLAEASIGKGIINVNKLDISNRAFDIKKISLKRSDVSLHSYNDTGRVAGDNPLLQIREMELLVVDILSSGENIGAVLKSLSFDSGNGVESFKMEGRLASNEGKTELEMELETKKSRLSISGKAATSLPEILKDPTAIGNAKLSINNSGISLSDISSFYPALKSVPVFTLAGLDPINIDGSLILDEEKLVIERFSLSQDNNFILIANGEIDNCFDLSIAGGDMLIEIPEIDTEWLRKIIPGEGVTGSMPEFGRLSLSVSLSNSFRAPGFDIRLRSDMGDARVSGMVNFDSDSFRVNSVFENILAGKILKTNTLDSFYGSILAVGKGFNPD